MASSCVCVSTVRTTQRKNNTEKDDDDDAIGDDRTQSIMYTLHSSSTNTIDIREADKSRKKERKKEQK